MSINKKYVGFVAKLLELTQDEKLEWQTKNPDEVCLANDIQLIGSIFETEYSHQVLRLYRFKLDVLEYDGVLNSALGLTAKIGFLADLNAEKYAKLQTYTRLAMVDEYGNNAFEFPGIVGLEDLYRAVSFKVSRVDSFISKITDEHD